MSKRNVSIATMLAAICWISSAGTVFAQNPSLGAADASGQIRITQASGSPVTLRDTRYAVVSGDRIATSADSSVVIRLPDSQGQLALTPDSDALFRRIGNRYEVTLSKGNLVYLLCRGTNILVTAGDVDLAGVMVEEQSELVSGSGVVALLESGSTAVAVREGELSVLERGSEVQRVSSGEEFTYFGSGAGMTQSVLSLVDESQLEGTDICGAPVVAGGGANTWLIGGLILGGAVVVHDQTRSTGSRDPVSP